MAETILICAATVREMEACLKGDGRPSESFASLPEHGGLPWARTWKPAENGRTAGGRNIVLAVTGVGMPLTVARLLPLAAGCSPSLIVNTGIAGAYPGSGLGIGDLIAGESECFGDMGMESPGPEAFLPLAGMAWADDVYRQPLTLSVQPWALDAASGGDKVRTGRGCTVNACTGREETGLLRRKLFAADFETMEGAGVALSARMLGIAAGELRAISNIASTRDMRPENVELALARLGDYMGRWLGKTA